MKKVLNIILILVALITLVACHSNDNEVSSDLSEEYNLWSEDIEYLVKTLEERHKNVYHTISKEELRNEVEAFKTDIENLSDTGKLLRIKTIVAKIGDAHTFVGNEKAENWFPIVINQFEDGYYVGVTTEEYEEIIGLRLVEINGVRIDVILEMISGIISYDNIYGLMTKATLYYRCADYLKYFGIIDNVESALFKFENNNGDYIEIDIDSYNYKKSPTNWIHIAEKYSKVNDMLIMRNFNNNYWYDFNLEDKLVYLQYNICRIDENKPIEEFTAEVLRTLRGNNVDKMIIDLRFNRGGDSRILEPLIRGVASNDDINQEGKLFVAISNKTNSSAVLNSLLIKKLTNATFIGQPTGGKPNHYGEVLMFTLPNSNIKIYYSSKFFKVIDTDEDALYPDIQINRTSYKFEDFLEGIDPIMEKILSID
ncbi:hypothetical protein RJG79_11505 [Mycoplasmatota bacterium WC44]